MAIHFVGPADVVEDKDNKKWGFLWHKLPPGDVVYLYGDFNLLKISKADGITITAEKPVNIKNLVLFGCNNTLFNGEGIVTIRSVYTGAIDKRPCLVSLYSCYKTILKKCNILSAEIENLRTENDWKTKTRHGIEVSQGYGCIVRKNSISNVYVAIQLHDEASEARCNKINNYCGDGIFLRANNTKAINNIIAFSYIDCIRGVNCAGTDKEGNHNDAIQIIGEEMSKNIYGPVSDIEIKGNVIYCPVGIGYDEETHGIASYNSDISNVTISDNKLLTNHDDAISITKANGCTIDNNVVLASDSNIPTIKIKHPASNNIFTSNKLDSKDALVLDGVTQDIGNRKLGKNARQVAYEDIVNIITDNVINSCEY